MKKNKKIDEGLLEYAVPVLSERLLSIISCRASPQLLKTPIVSKVEVSTMNSITEKMVNVTLNAKDSQIESARAEFSSRKITLLALCKSFYNVPKNVDESSDVLRYRRNFLEAEIDKFINFCSSRGSSEETKEYGSIHESLLREILLEQAEDAYECRYIFEKDAPKRQAYTGECSRQIDVFGAFYGLC